MSELRGQRCPEGHRIIRTWALCENSIANPTSAVDATQARPYFCCVDEQPVRGGFASALNIRSQIPRSARRTKRPWSVWGPLGIGSQPSGTALGRLDDPVQHQSTRYMRLSVGSYGVLRACCSSILSAVYYRVLIGRRPPRAIRKESGRGSSGRPRQATQVRHGSHAAVLIAPPAAAAARRRSVLA